MPDYRSLQGPVPDLFYEAIPQLMPKWDSGQNMLLRQAAVGLGLPVGVVGGVMANNLVKGALDAAMLPGDVYTGRADLNTPEGFGRVMNMTGMLASGGMPIAEAGALGAFGGKTYYHGSPNKFERFSSEKIGTITDAGDLGRGFYFSTDANVPKGSAYHYEADLDLSNPLHVSYPKWGYSKKTGGC